MTVIDHPKDRAWAQGEVDTIAVMGTLNAAAAQLVLTIRMLLDTDGWNGWGIQSLEHWVTWKAAVAPARAKGLVRIARRLHELPACWALFEQGRVTEDAMARVARRVPAEMDAEVAEKLPVMTIRQLERGLAACPPMPDVDPAPRIEPERHLTLSHTRDGWLNGSFSLPPDEGAVVEAGLTAARDAEFRDRQGLEPTVDLEGTTEWDRRKEVTWADALVRLGSEGADAFDPTLERTGQRGERNKVVLHRDIDAAGLGPAQLHLGPTLPEDIARYLECDAEAVVALYQDGRLLGFTPTARTVNRAMRRAIERRDQGCATRSATRRDGSTSTTSSSGRTAASRSPKTSSASVRSTTGLCTPATSASRATPISAPSGSSTDGGARWNHLAPGRRGCPTDETPAPSPHRSVSACPRSGSPGTDPQDARRGAPPDGASTIGQCTSNLAAR